VAPLRVDAALHEPAPPRRPGTNGRPRVKGERLPQLEQVLKDPQTIWHRVRVRWYNGCRRELGVTSGTAVWYRIGQPVLPIRSVLVCGPKGLLGPRAYFSTCPNDRPRAVVQPCITSWAIETTFEESRTYLGLETQRQWSDRAIERTTPCLFGLYSVVALLAHALHPDGKIPPAEDCLVRQAPGEVCRCVGRCSSACMGRVELLNIRTCPRLYKDPKVRAFALGASTLLRTSTCTKSSLERLGDGVFMRQVCHTMRALDKSLNKLTMPS
jgi:hypothetical protein